MKKTRHVSLRTRLVRCTSVGVVMAALYSAWVTVVYLFHPQTFVRLGASYGSVVALYFIVFSVGGAFVGLVWNLCRFRTFAYLTSILVAVVVAIGCGVVLDGMPSQWDWSSWFVVPIFGLVFGIFFGGSLYKGVKSNSLDWDSD